MKKTLKLTALFIIAMCFIACSDDKNIDDDGDGNRDIIPTTKFELPKGCRWKNDLEKNKLFTINNTNELENLVVSENKQTFDLEGKTLLLVHVAVEGRSEVANELYVKPDTKNLYVFNVILPSNQGMIEAILLRHYIAVLVNKVDGSVPIELSITRGKD